MPMRLASPIAARVVQVLQDFLPAEVDLVDSEEGYAEATPDIPNGNYHAWGRRLIPDYPAVTVELRAMATAAGDLSVHSQGMGNQAHMLHEVEVSFHVQAASAEDDALELKRWVEAYVSAGFRVLCVKKDRLQTTADPTQFAFAVTFGERVEFSPEAAQEGGSLVRTARLPIVVARIEQT